jgi:hypothetical protein
MQKKMTKQPKRDPETVAIVKIVAKEKGLSQRSVRRVITGTQKNEEVLEAFMFMHEGVNLLKKAIRKAVPL